MAAYYNNLGASTNSSAQIKSEFLGLGPRHTSFPRTLIYVANLKITDLDWDKTLGQLHKQCDTFSLPHLYPGPISDITIGNKWLDTICHLPCAFCYLLGLYILLVQCEWRNELTAAAWRWLIRIFKKGIYKSQQLILIEKLLYPLIFFVVFALFIFSIFGIWCSFSFQNCCGAYT